MDIEKQRGISVTSSVMQFDYAGKRVNILDTPGHEDFSEDTYRTLMAVDAAVMVVDSAKGIEAQTKKLFEVVKHRNIPVFTFINKLDRDGREPLDLLEELEEVLGIASYPMNWPIGMGKSLKGFMICTTNVWNFTKVMNVLQRLKMVTNYLLTTHSTNKSWKMLSC